MSVAEELRDALAFTGLPMAQTTYTDNAASYLVFNYTTMPDHFADDAPQYERYLIQVHLVTPLALNTTALERQIKRALAAHDFAYPSTVDASDESRQGNAGATRHLVFETEKVAAV